MPKTPSKIFIIGLPRTGTTSLCAGLLALNYKVAHTAYTKHAFATAEVIADTPIFYAYQYLDKQYPNAKFIYLTRESKQWLPSISKLLNRMYNNVVSESGGFNPMIKEAYTETFSPFTHQNINSDVFLHAKYQKHEQEVLSYFSERTEDLLTLNLSDENSWLDLCRFLEVEDEDTLKSNFPHLNVNGKVTAWNDVHHPLKVPSTHNGRIDKMSFTL